MRWSETKENAHILVNASISSSDGNDYKIIDLFGESGANEFQGDFGFPLDEELDLKDRLQQEQKHLQISGALHDVRFDFSHNESNSEYFYVAPAVEDGSIRKTNDSRFTIGYNKDISEPLNFDAQISYNDHQTEEIYDALFPGFIGYRTLDFYAWNYEARLSYTPSENLNIVSGFERQSMFDEHEVTHVPARYVENEVVNRVERTTNAIYSQLNFKISEKLRTVVGVRVEEQLAYRREYFENIELDTTPSRIGNFKKIRNTTPRVSLIYQPNPSQVFKLMAGDAIKLVNRRRSDLIDEEYQTIEANYVYTQEKFLFSASVFKNTMKNLLVESIYVTGKDSSGKNTTATYTTSSGDISTNGIELLLKTDWTESFNSEIGATWQNSENRSSPTGEVSFSPELVSNFKLNYHRNNFAAALLVRYVSSMFPQYTEPAIVDEMDSVEGQYSGHRVPGHIVADLSFRLDDIWDLGYVSLQLTNIFDQEVRYPNNALNSYLLHNGTIGNGRGARITLGIDF